MHALFTTFAALRRTSVLELSSCNLFESTRSGRNHIGYFCISPDLCANIKHSEDRPLWYYKNLNRRDFSTYMHLTH